MSGGAAQLMLGPLISEQIVGVATILTFTMTASMLCAGSAPSGWLVPVVFARAPSFGALLVALLWGVFTLPATITPLLVEGCESGYIVKERSLLLVSSITVFEKDGLLITPVTRARTTATSHSPTVDTTHGRLATGSMARLLWNRGLRDRWRHLRCRCFSRSALMHHSDRGVAVRYPWKGIDDA